MATDIHGKSEADGCQLVCVTIKLDVLELCSSTPLPVRRFFGEALALVGVYWTCPECVKLRSQSGEEAPSAVLVEGQTTTI
jgi:hypothetical protein